MYPMPGNCPVCGETLEVSRMNCLQCGTSIEGHFSLGKLWRLNAEQIFFVETFIRCEGTIKRVEKELGISYPTVRSRLKDVIRAMGFEVISDYVDRSSTRLSEEERSAILDRLYKGEISSEEALEMLRGDE
nr:DUF2089 domain-containing protein [Anaerolineae bacterium]